MLLSKTVQRRLPKFSTTAFFALIPSFLQSSATKVHPTSYLAGLRGLAALCVWIPLHRLQLEVLSASLQLQPSLCWLFRSAIALCSHHPQRFTHGAYLLRYLRIRAGVAAVGGSLRARRWRKEKTETKVDSETEKRQIERNFTKCASLLASSALRRPIRLWNPPIVLTLLYIPLLRLPSKSLLLPSK